MRRCTVEMHDKFKQLARLLKTEIINPNEEKEGIYLHWDVGRYFVFKKIQTNGKHYDRMMILSNDPLTSNQMYEQLCAVVSIIISFNLVPEHVVRQESSSSPLDDWNPV